MGRTGMTPTALGLGAAWLNQCSESETISTILRAIELGINYIDTYHREGLYPAPLPFTPGVEAAGRVEAVGSEVDNVQIGDRVAYCLTLGSYAEKSVVDLSLIHI